MLFFVAKMIVKAVFLSNAVTHVHASTREWPIVFFKGAHTEADCQYIAEVRSPVVSHCAQTRQRRHLVTFAVFQLPLPAVIYISL